MCLGDVDGDGDFLLQSPVFGPEVDNSDFTPNVVDVHLQDLNGDGLIDDAWDFDALDDGGGPDTHLVLKLSDGNGIFHQIEPDAFIGAEEWHSSCGYAGGCPQGDGLMMIAMDGRVVVIDYDGDGDEDLVEIDWLLDDRVRVRVWLNQEEPLMEKIFRLGNELKLEFVGTLEMSDLIHGEFKPIENASSPFLLDIRSEAMFLRVR